MAQTERQEIELYGQDLPFSLEAEQSVLGAVLVDSSCLSTVLDTLRPNHFYREEHSRVFEIMIRLFTTAQPVDFVTVLEQACRDSVFPSEGEARVYLAQLVQIVPSIRNVDAYAGIVRERFYVRSLILAAREIIENASSGYEDAQTLIDSAEQMIYDIRADRHSSRLLQIDQILLDIYDRLQRISGDDKERYLGTPTSYSALDRVTTGLNKSDLILMAGRPSMGKSAIALNIASNVALNAKKKVVIFTLEMSREQVVERMLATHAKVPGVKMRTGELSAQEWIRLAVSARELAAAPIYVDDTASITVPEIKARLRRERDVGLVIIDYLQLMSGTTRNDNRVQVIGEITRSLKVMAKELDVPLILCSQLSRGPEARSDHRPIMSDLRDSGAIEQDADIVILLYRDFYYNRDTDEPNVAELIVSKNRHGETGTVKLGWNGEHMRYTTLELFRDDG